ncbi:MAG: PDR/VanB family oxidoreductase [Marmoricola sp.]
MAAQSKLRWQPAEVLETSDVADGVRRIVIRPRKAQPAAPGSHLDVEVTQAGRTIRRSYSVVRSEDEGRRQTISVQLAPTSRGGSRAMHALREGDSLRVSYPLLNFPLGVGAARYVLVAGGIGITALVAMASALRRRGADYAVVLVGRSRGVMAYLDDLVEEHGDRLEVHVDDEGTPLDVRALVGEVSRSDHAATTELYMCGPIRLMDALRREWTRHELPGPNLRFETFGNSGAWAPEPFRVRIPALDREVTVGEEVSMLDALENAGVEVMWDCRKGECGLCVVRVLGCDGQIDHRDVFLSDEQKEQDGSLCACVSRVATGDRTLAQAGLRTLTIDVP